MLTLNLQMMRRFRSAYGTLEIHGCTMYPFYERCFTSYESMMNVMVHSASSPWIAIIKESLPTIQRSDHVSTIPEMYAWPVQAVPSIRRSINNINLCIYRQEPNTQVGLEIIYENKIGIHLSSDF